MGGTEEARVFYLDPSALARDSFRVLLAPRQDIVLVGSASCLEEGLEVAAELSFDVLLAAFDLPDDELGATVRAFRRLHPGLPVIALTSTSLESEELMLSTFDHGVNTLLTMDVKLEELVEAVHAVKRGESYLPGSLASSLIGLLQSRTARSHPGEVVLTEREGEVLGLLAEGRSNAEIAESLSLSLSTVKTELRGMFRKLDVSTRTELLVTALQIGLVESPR